MFLLILASTSAPWTKWHSCNEEVFAYNLCCGFSKALSIGTESYFKYHQSLNIRSQWIFEQQMIATKHGTVLATDTNKVFCSIYLVFIQRTFWQQGLQNYVGTSRKIKLLWKLSSTKVLASPPRGNSSFIKQFALLINININVQWTSNQVTLFHDSERLEMMQYWRPIESTHQDVIMNSKVRGAFGCIGEL